MQIKICAINRQIHHDKPHIDKDTLVLTLTQSYFELQYSAIQQLLWIGFQKSCIDALCNFSTRLLQRIEQLLEEQSKILYIDLTPNRSFWYAFFAAELR